MSSFFAKVLVLAPHLYSTGKAVYKYLKHEGKKHRRSRQIVW